MLPITEMQAKRYFGYFAAIHLLLWTILPWLVSPNLPLDVIESAAWGQQFVLGTYKHPPMPSWWLEILGIVTGHAGFAYALASQIAIVIGFWAIWDLARRWFNPLTAFIGVILLEAVPYYNFTSPEFNHNVLLLCFWPLIVRSYYLAVTTSNTRHWLFFGVWAACGMYSKYFTVVLLFTLVVFTLVNPIARQQLKTKGPYLAIVLSLLLFAPHFMWLAEHHFLPITYTESRLSNSTGQGSIVGQAGKFTLTQFAFLLPMLLIGLLLRNKQNTEKIQSTPFDRLFLHVITFGPFIVTCLISVSMKAELKDMWGMPLWNYIGLWFVAMLGMQLQHVKKSFITVWAVWAVAIAVIFAVTTFGQPYFKASIKRVQFPGVQMATVIDETWQNRFHTPLPYSIGETWVSGNLAYYAPSHPTIFTNNDPVINHWINVNEVNAKGGVYLNWRCTKACSPEQSAQEADAFAAQVKQAYPTAEIQPPLSLKAQTNSTKPAPIIIDWAIIPPKE